MLAASKTLSAYESLVLYPEGSQALGGLFSLSQVCLSLQFLSEKELHGNENLLKQNPSWVFAFSIFLVYFFSEKLFQHLVLPGPKWIALQLKQSGIITEVWSSECFHGVPRSKACNCNYCQIIFHFIDLTFSPYHWLSIRTFFPLDHWV